MQLRHQSYRKVFSGTDNVAHFSFTSHSSNVRTWVLHLEVPDSKMLRALAPVAWYVIHPWSDQMGLIVATALWQTCKTSKLGQIVSVIAACLVISLIDSSTNWILTNILASNQKMLLSLQAGLSILALYLSFAGHVPRSDLLKYISGFQLVGFDQKKWATSLFCGQWAKTKLNESNIMQLTIE